MASLFTKIIDGDIPARFVWRSEDVVAFLDIEPLTDGHALVVPTLEIDLWTDLEPAVRDRMFAVAQAIGKAQCDVFGAPRAGLIVQGFEVPHAHVHVFPTTGPRDFDFRRRGGRDADELDDDARRLREALRAAGHGAAIPTG